MIAVRDPAAASPLFSLQSIDSTRNPEWHSRCISGNQLGETLNVDSLPLVVQAARAILRYFDDYPNAKDTTLGIANWWVLLPEDVVEEALQLLVEMKFVKHIQFAGAGRIYMADPAGAEQARRWRSEAGVKEHRG